MSPYDDLTGKAAHPSTAHIPISVLSQRVWNGRYYEWVHEARCTCGWLSRCNTELLAEVTAAEHARVQTAAMEFGRR